MIPDRSRVLIADADSGLRLRLHKRLLDISVFSDPVADGKEALSKLQERPYSVVLLDPALPQGASAEQVLRLISSFPAEQRPVVLLLASGAVAKTFDVDLIQVVLRKPCDIAQLAEIVGSCVRASSEHSHPTTSSAAPHDSESAAPTRPC